MVFVKSSYLRHSKKWTTVKFEAESYNFINESLSEVSVTCYGSLRENIVILFPDEFNDDNESSHF